MAIKNIDEHNDINKEIEWLSKRYGEIMLPKYDEDKKHIYSEQFGLVVLKI